jgi:hypothetical protein
MNDQAPSPLRRAAFACLLGLDRNPLRRRADWLELAIMAGLLAVFLAGAPLAAIAAVGWAHGTGLREQQVQRSWHQVSVVLLQPAPRQAAFRHWTPPARVRARWTTPRGQARAGEVPAPPGSPAGSRVRVWAGRFGPVAGVPLASDALTAREIAAAILAPACLAIVVLALARAARWLLNRRRLADWEAAWTRADATWARHR